uniref:Uncharacterized protein n=1 Tax=Arundo donax TaxID=35708 RepID=A0A0A9GG84_ARUDO
MTPGSIHLFKNYHSPGNLVPCKLFVDNSIDRCLWIGPRVSGSVSTAGMCSTTQYRADRMNCEMQRCML